MTTKKNDGSAVLGHSPTKPESVNTTTTEAELKKFRDLAAANLRGWQRARADYQNLAKETAREKEVWVTAANEQLILEILPVLDNFNHALKHLPQELAQQDWVKGVIFIKTQLANILEHQGVSVINALHQPFDPHFHEAVAKVPGKPEFRDKVVAELQKGYLRQGRVIRAARVKVGG